MTNRSPCKLGLNKFSVRNIDDDDDDYDGDDDFHCQADGNILPHGYKDISIDEPRGVKRKRGLGDEDFYQNKRFCGAKSSSCYDTRSSPTPSSKLVSSLKYSSSTAVAPSNTSSLSVASSLCLNSAPPNSRPEPIPSTSYEPVPSASYEPVPSTSYEPVPSTSYEPAPSTSYEPAPSTSYEPVPSTSYEPAHSTSYEPSPSTCYEPAPSTMMSKYIPYVSNSDPAPSLPTQSPICLPFDLSQTRRKRRAPVSSTLREFEPAPKRRKLTDCGNQCPCKTGGTELNIAPIPRQGRVIENLYRKLLTSRVLSRAKAVSFRCCELYCSETWFEGRDPFYGIIFDYLSFSRTNC